MADKAISELVAAEQIKSTDMFVLEQDGTAKRLQGQTLLNWLTAAADGHGGISNIAKTGTDGLADTYTITLADTTTKTFTVTNGNGLTNFEKVSTEGLVDNYRFTRTDGTFFDFSVYNGAKGDKGEDSHVWIKYASQQPTADSHSMGDLPDAWMGVYSGTAAEAPDDWQQYTWYQIKGEKGDTGAAATVTGTTVEYMVSDSGTIVPSGSWSTTIPTVPQGKYLWTKVTTTFNTGSPAVSYSVTRMGIDGAGSVSSVNEKSPDESGNVSLSAEDIPTSGGRSVQAVLDDKQEALTAGENISISGSVIATKAFPCNPKILDNWYFGNPVNQRNGRIVPAGTPYFLAGSSTQSGVLSSPATVIGYLNSGGLYPQIKVDGETYITPIGTDIAGYAGPGYGIDRWKLFVSGGVAVAAGGLQLDSVTNFGQVLEGSRVPDGIKATASVLTDEGLAAVTFALNGEAQQIFTAIVGGITLYFTGNWAGSGRHLIMLDGTGLVKAVGLELGPQQTLAHQDADGNWVLNEIPDYGEQLAACQRYYQRLKASSGYMRFGLSIPLTDTTANVFIPLIEEMRAVPTVNAHGDFALYLQDKFYGVSIAMDTLSPYNAVLVVTGTNLLSVMGQLLANADVNAYIEFSADL